MQRRCVSERVVFMRERRGRGGGGFRLTSVSYVHPSSKNKTFAPKLFSLSSSRPQTLTKPAIFARETSCDCRAPHEKLSITQARRGTPGTSLRLSSTSLSPVCHFISFISLTLFSIYTTTVFATFSAMITQNTSTIDIFYRRC